MRRLAPTLLLLTLVLAACGDDDADTVDAGDDGGDTAADVTYADLDGQTFVSTGSQGYEIVAGSAISLSFADERISANAGCNTQNAGVEVVDGRLEIVGQMASTMMGCEEPLMAQDQWVASFLEAGPVADLNGPDLTLNVDDEVLELSAES